MSYKVSYYKNVPVVDVETYVRSDEPEDEFNDIEIDVFLQSDLKSREKDKETNNTGLVESIFPTLALAEMYAKNIPGAKITECNIETKPIEIKKLPPGIYSNNLSTPTGKMTRMYYKLMKESQNGEMI